MQVPRVLTPTDRAGIRIAILAALGPVIVSCDLHTCPGGCDACDEDEQLTHERQNLICGLSCMLWGEHANGRAIWNGNLGNIDYREDWGWTGDVFALTAKEGAHSNNTYKTKLLVAPGSMEEGARYYIKVLNTHYPEVMPRFSEGDTVTDGESGWCRAIKYLKEKSYFSAPLYGPEGYYPLFSKLVREYKRTRWE